MLYWCFQRFPVVSSANAGGQKRDNQLTVLEPHTAFGRSRLALKSFDTEGEANNFYNYARSKFIRFTFLLTDENLSSLAKLVPDLLDYTQNQKLINFTKDIDEQFIKLLDLTDEEVKRIEDRVDNLRQKLIQTELDAQLYRKYGLSQEEIDFIESKVKEMEQLNMSDFDLNNVISKLAAFDQQDGFERKIELFSYRSQKEEKRNI